MKRGTPMTNSNARKRLEAQRIPHPDPAVCELMARAWDEGFTKAGRLLLNMDIEDWPPTPNPYRSAL